MRAFAPGALKTPALTGAACFVELFFGVDAVGRFLLEQLLLPVKQDIKTQTFENSERKQSLKSTVIDYV